MRNRTKRDRTKPVTASSAMLLRLAPFEKALLEALAGRVTRGRAGVIRDALRAYAHANPDFDEEAFAEKFRREVVAPASPAARKVLQGQLDSFLLAAPSDLPPIAGVSAVADLPRDLPPPPVLFDPAVDFGDSPKR